MSVRTVEASRATASAPPGPSPDARPLNRDELDLIALLADHPSLLPIAEEHGVLSLLTDARLRDMYSASLQAGASLLEHVSGRLPPPIAEIVLSGRFSQHPDPARLLAQMVANLRVRDTEMARKDLERRLAEARRSGDRELERRLAVEATLNRKQVD